MFYFYSQKVLAARISAASCPCAPGCIYVVYGRKLKDRKANKYAGNEVTSDDQVEIV